MQPPPTPVNEAERIVALRRYQILDTSPEQEYDDLTKLASHICKTPIALITLIDSHRQWFKSKIGIEISETSRDIAFCAHAILQNSITIVKDASTDPRFAQNPFVTGAPYIRFYAGVPLITPDRHAMGTLCVLDNNPHEFTPEQREALEALARQVVAHLELRRSVVDLQQAKEIAEAATQTKSRFLAGRRILLVEDNPINLVVEKAMLENLECQVDTAENGREAVEQIQKATYDLVLMDCQMPVVDGYEATSRIRLLGGTFAKVPIIALTAGVMEWEREQCLGVGMNDFLGKPFTLKQLGQAMTRWLPNDSARAPQLPEPRGRSTIDTECLRALESTMKSSGNLKRMLELYVTDGTRRLGAMREAAAAGDYAKVRAAAHSLKGSSGMVGATKVAKLCAILSDKEKLDPKKTGELIERASKALELASNEFAGIVGTFK